MDRTTHGDSLGTKVMIIESGELKRIRDQLSIVERRGISVQTSRYLDEVAYQIDRLTETNPLEQRTARNIGKTYGQHIERTIESRLSISHLCERELENMLDLIRFLRSTDVFMCPGMTKTMRKVFWRLMDIYFEGYNEGEKRSEITRILNARTAIKRILGNFSKKSADS